MRDQLKTYDYFATYLEQTESLISDGSVLLEENKVKEEMIPSFKMNIIEMKINKVIAKYSIGHNMLSLKQELSTIAIVLPDFWDAEKAKIKFKEGNHMNDYRLLSYEYLLTYLSIGKLLKEESAIEKVKELLNRDNVKDLLFEIILERRLINTVELNENKKAVILDIYKDLHAAYFEKDPLLQSKLVKRFLEKSFYHKHTRFYNRHKNKHIIYSGYWSFEAAVIVCLLDIDDSSFRNNKYYPKDLVDYYRNTSS